MTEYSLLWATSTSGDGSDAYTSDETRKLWLAMFSNGVFKGYLNDLAVTGTASPIAVNSGAAVIQGHPYFNTASVSKTVTTPSTNTTGLRVVVRVDWLGRAASTTNPIYPATNQYEARIVVITSPDGTAAIPDPITTDADTYDLTLATGTITTAGVIALTDARTYTKARREEIAAADIANRTRSFFIPAVGFDSSSDDTVGIYQHGMELKHGEQNEIRGWGAVPSDFVSGMTVKAIVCSNYAGASTGNAYINTGVTLAANGEAMADLQQTGLYADAVTASQQKIMEWRSLSLTGAAVGDYLSCYIYRNGLAAQDTCTTSIFVMGFLVTYTADS